MMGSHFLASPLAWEVWTDSQPPPLSAKDIVPQDAGILESVPGAGHVLAAANAAVGEPEHAKRMAAKSTNSAIEFTTTLAGSVAGGPAGAAAGSITGAASGALLGDTAEKGIADRIKDDGARKGAGGFNVEKVAGDVLGASFAAAASAGSKQLTKEGFRRIGTHGMKKTAGHVSAGFGASKGARAGVGGTLKA